MVELPTTTVAPMNFAICSPISPTPELAPWIMMALPGAHSPCVTTALCMVCKATGSVAATSQPMLLPGNGFSRPQSATAYSA